MHALVPPILLRRSGKDEVRFDAELEPPGRQPGQPPRTGRPERCSIIAADRKRQPVGSKGRREGRLNTLDRRLRDPNVKQKAAMAVGQRQGIDLALIGGTEPTLEVGRPLVVRSRHTRKWAPLINRSAPALHRRNQPGLLENVADRGGSRPTHLGSSAAEYHQQLAGPQVRKPPAQRNDLIFERGCGRVRTMQRSMRVVHKPVPCAALPPLPPGIKRIAADPITGAQLRYAPVPGVIVHQHSNALFHGTGLCKRHRWTPLRCRSTCRQSIPV